MNVLGALFEHTYEIYWKDISNKNVFRNYDPEMYHANNSLIQINRIFLISFWEIYWLYSLETTKV